MRVSDLRHHGAAFSDAEGSWSPALKGQMRRKGRTVILSHLGWLQRAGFVLRFLSAMRRARRLDLSAVRSRGLDNEPFLALQLEYLATFVALARTLDSPRAVAIMKRVMDETAHEPLLQCLPEPERVREAGEPFAVFREYFRASPAANERAGCLTLAMTEQGDDAFQFDVSWCVWLELARLMGVPEACIPNCHADDLVFPEYFEQFGVRYRRSGTLAMGAACCDFRFERAGEADREQTPANPRPTGTP